MDTVRKYLSACAQDDSIASALIHMPTGTGKSGVIACVSHFLQNAGCALLLCPRIALRDQLAREAVGRFFTKLGLSAELPKTVHNVRDTYPHIQDEDYPRSIVAMTIQMLYSMRNRGNPHFAKLQEKVDLVIVDEGHYEPALMWREAIRDLGAPKVLFTATPFRNDLKLFDVNFQHAYSYTFGQAVDDRTIRRVEIHPRPARNSPQAFVADVVAFYDQQFPAGNNPATRPRVIIRCDSQAEIRQIGTALEAAGQSYVLIHENFSDNDPARPHEKQHVPDPDQEAAIFWVHQFKLLEGIDDPRFQLLGIYNEFKNTRGIVQQIGRVIRNPSRQADAVGHVLDHSGGRQRELWEGFLRFDQLVQDQGVEAADFTQKLLVDIQAAQPDVVYLDGRFRTRMILGDIDPADELVLPATVNVFRKSDVFDLAALCGEIEKEYRQEDKDVRRVNVGATEVFLYVTFRNSPLLRSTCFVECRFGVTIIREVGEYLCYFDSGGGSQALLGRHVTSVCIAELRRLFKNATRTYLTSVSLHNSQLGPRSIRARTISAARIEKTLPTFDDHACVCRTAQGYSEERGARVRRYVGFGRGKVTESRQGRATFAEYMQWLDGVANILGSNARSVASFARFAAHSDPPADPVPLHLLLDVGEVRDHFETTDFDGIAAGEPMQIDDACCEVQNGQFTIRANGRPCSGTITFDPRSGRYRLDSPDLEAMYHSQENSLSRGLVRYFNHEQSFRVIPTSEGSFYTLGSFYTPISRFGDRYDDDQIGLLKILHAAACLDNIGSEKGATCEANGSAWDPQSLFSIIDSLGVEHGLDAVFGNPDIVVCDDMGTESADFILAYTAERRVVFIHAKGNTGEDARLYAASPLQEVCGQAVKNLRYFSRYGNERPPKAANWHSKAWSARGVAGKVTSRIRRAPAGVNTGVKVWGEVQKIIRDPYVDLQVWLFLGRLLSRDKLEARLKAKNPPAEAKQAAYLLFATMNDVASVGARMKVICSN